MTIKTIIDAWVASDPSYTWSPPATEAEIRAAEEQIGSPLPPPLRELYQFSNGGDIMDVVFLFQLLPNNISSLGLSNSTAMFNELGWHNPQEILLFATNGLSEAYGIWLPETDSEVFKQPIIEVAPTDEGCMAVVGTNLTSFLLGRTAYHLVFEIDNFDGSKKPDASKKLKQLQIALDILQVPQTFRHVEFFDDSDHHFSQIIKWADPSLPNPCASSYIQEYTVTDLKKLFGDSRDD
ncbi:MAG: SMI1/KNR4 family protein [Candidatus Poribacteria bacterium]|nr:SMI1/KNR4 family protein [Candidatus Poribacteria bacterium]